MEDTYDEDLWVTNRHFYWHSIANLFWCSAVTNTFHCTIDEYDKYMDNPDFWWLVGRYFGDGNLSENKGCVDICCAKDENEEIKSVIDRLGIKYSIHKKYTANHFCISSTELVSFLSQFGVG